MVQSWIGTSIGVPSFNFPRKNFSKMESRFPIWSQRDESWQPLPKKGCKNKLEKIKKVISLPQLRWDDRWVLCQCVIRLRSKECGTFLTWSNSLNFWLNLDLVYSGKRWVVDKKPKVRSAQEKVCLREADLPCFSLGRVKRVSVRSTSMSFPG